MHIFDTVGDEPGGKGSDPRPGGTGGGNLFAFHFQQEILSVTNTESVEQ